MPQGSNQPTRSFASDNNAGVHPEVLEAIARANQGHVVAYGDDRFTRSAVLEVVGNDYVRAARAKGLPERTVVRRYVLRAALPSVITVLGLVFANVLTGAVLVEKIFS